MINESITFDKLPQAVSYLTEQVIELKQMVSALQPTSSANNLYWLRLMRLLLL